MNKLIQTFTLNHFSPSAVVSASYNEVRSGNEFHAQTVAIITHLLNPTGDQAQQPAREEATALYLIEVVEGYSLKRDKPAAKIARDCLRTRLNAHLKSHGLKISFKLKTSTKLTRIEFTLCKTEEEEKDDRAAAKEQNNPQTTQDSSEQLEAIQEEKSIADQKKILVKLASDLPADDLEDLIVSLQLLQIEREEQAATNLKEAV